jgi:hypothetical protein
MALLDRSYGLGLGIKADENEMRNLEQQAKGQSTQGSISAPAPAGVDPKVWAVMTPEERALWNK